MASTTSRRLTAEEILSSRPSAEQRATVARLQAWARNLFPPDYPLVDEFLAERQEEAGGE